MVFYALELGAPLPIATAAIMSYPTIVALILVFPLSIYADRSGKRLEIHGNSYGSRYSNASTSINKICTN
ncbi:MAG: hypothetical protein QW775_06530, partial [Ignisphaera sp.]